MNCVRRLGLLIAFLAAPASAFGQAAGAMPSGGSGNGGGKSSQTVREDAGDPGLGEILESFGQWTVNRVSPQREPPSVEKPDWNSRKSPRHTVLTFEEAMRHVEYGRTDAWPRAKRTLGFDAEDANLREHAEALHQAFSRLGELNRTQLPGPEEVEERGLRRFPVFPRGEAHAWVWETLSEPPEGEIVVERNADGEWVFTAETVRNAGDLAESLASLPPNAREGRRGELFLRVIEPTFQQTPWWSWLVAAGALVVGVGLAMLIASGLRRLSDRLRERGSETTGDVLRGFAWPTALLAFTLVLGFGLIFVQFGPTLSSARWTLLQLLLVIAAGWLVLEVADVVAYGIQHLVANSDGHYDTMALLVVRRSLRAIVLVFLAIFVLQNGLGFEVTALLTGVGLAGLAIALAAQGMARNVFGAISIFVNRPFAVGDWVNFKDRIGEVVDVGIHCTTIRLLSGELLVVPNVQFTDQEVANYSLRKYLRRTMNIAVTYHTPADKVLEATRLIDEVLRDDEVVREGHCNLDEKPPVISFNEFGSHYLNLRVYYWYFMEQGETRQRDSDRGWFSFLAHCDLVNRKLLAAFNEAGVDFAFPTSTVHLTDGEGREFPLLTEPSHNGSNGDGRHEPERAGRGQSAHQREQPEKQPMGGDGDSGDGDGR